MCSIEESNELADLISSHVTFENLDEARSFSEWYKQPRTSELSLQVHNMAAELYVHRVGFGIADYMKNKCYGGSNVKRSRLREAITICAQRAVIRMELEELADMVNPEPQGVEVRVLA